MMVAAPVEVSVFETWATILTVAATAVAGDVLTAGAMRRITSITLRA